MPKRVNRVGGILIPEVMKRLMILMVALAFLTGQCYSQQTEKIGNVNGSKLVITNQKALNNYFNQCLANSGTLGKEMKIESSPTADRFFVSTNVSGNKDKVTAIGVLLVNRNNEALIVEVNVEEGDATGPGVGGSMNVQCIGAPCEVCYPVLEWPVGQWYPLVRCGCFDLEGKCNSLISFTVNLGVGF